MHLIKMDKYNFVDNMFKEIFFSPGHDFYNNAKIPTIEEFIEYCNSNRTYEEKATQLLFNLIILDKRKKYPTAKEMLKAFLQSNINKTSKKEIINFILNDNYMNPVFREEFGNERVHQRIKKYSKFMSKVTKNLNNMAPKTEILFTRFDFVTREAVFWLIDNNPNPMEIIKSILKKKSDWMDIAEQNGILDYCYNNHERLGKDFVIDVFSKAIKTNMREIRLVAYRYVYRLTRNEKYLIMMKNDPSAYIRRKIEIIKNEKTSKNTAFS